MLRKLMVVVLAASGCATLPRTGEVQATGEPMSVESGIVTHEWVSKDKVAEVQHQDANGNNIGKSDVYEDRVHTSKELVWLPRQGALPLDDEDFFRLTGDEQAANEVHSTRESGVFMNHVGWGVVAAGLAGLAGGLALNSSSDTGTQQAGLYLTSGGLLTASIGSLRTWWGLRQAAAQHPLNDNIRAEKDAEAYNQRLAAASRPAPPAIAIPEETPAFPTPPQTPARSKRARRSSVVSTTQP